VPAGPQETAFYEEVSLLEDHIEEQVRADGYGLHVRSSLQSHPADDGRIEFRIEVTDPARPGSRPATAEWDMADGSRGRDRESLFRQARKEVIRQWSDDEFAGVPHIDTVVFGLEEELVPMDENGAPLGEAGGD
jgi:hypothetical protein